MYPKTLAYCYWTILLISILIILSNIGLVFVALGIIVIPLLIKSVKIGLNLHRLTDKKILIFIISFNWLSFALIKPEGAHAMSENGLSQTLHFFGVSGGFNREYSGSYFIVALILLLLQTIISLQLLKLIRLSKKANSINNRKAE